MHKRHVEQFAISVTLPQLNSGVLRMDPFKLISNTIISFFNCRGFCLEALDTHPPHGCSKDNLFLNKTISWITIILTMGTITESWKVWLICRTVPNPNFSEDPSLLLSDTDNGQKRTRQSYKTGDILMGFIGGEEKMNVLIVRD